MKSIGTVPLSKRVKYKISARPHAGLFFCLASAEGAGLLFLPCCNTAPYKRLQHVLFRPCNYAAHAAKRLTGLYRGFSCDLSHSTATNTRPTQAAIIPPASRWSVSQRRDASSTYRIPAPRRTLYRSAQPPYYNNVYKSVAVRPCYGSMPDSAAYHRPCKPGGVCVSTCTGSARRLAIWHPPPGGAVQWRAARNH